MLASLPDFQNRTEIGESQSGELKNYGIPESLKSYFKSKKIPTVLNHRDFRGYWNNGPI